MAFALVAWLPVIYKTAAKLRLIPLHAAAGVLLAGAVVLYTFRKPPAKALSPECGFTSAQAMAFALQGSAKLTLFLGAWAGYKYYGK